MNFDITKNGQMQTIALKGSFSHADHGTFGDVVKILESEDSRHFVFDLSELQSIDTAGLGLLLLAKDAAEKKAATLTLNNPSWFVRNLFNITHFNELISVEN